MTAFTWALAGLSLLATLLNIRKQRACFAIWLGTNASWAAVDLAHNLPAQAALQSVYAGLSVWGWIQWSKRA